MKINIEHKGQCTVLHLSGRLDITWADHIAEQVRALLRSGRHRLLVDASQISYLSSAGIRVLLKVRREVAAVSGTFAVVRPSEFVEKTLRMSGLDQLLAADAEIAALAPDSPPATAASELQCIEDTAAVAGMVLEVYPLERQEAMHPSVSAAWQPWAPVKDGDIRAVALPANLLALGIGAAGDDPREVRGRFGEFLAVAGHMAWQPADEHPHQPDYVTQAGNFVPEIQAIQALTATGAFSKLLRFRPDGDGNCIPFSTLAACALHSCDADAVAIVVMAEIEGLVGTALSRSPGLIDEQSQPGQFPEVRDWMNFCGERVHAGQSALVASFAARQNAPEPWSAFLSALPSEPGIAAHSHAVVFPFRPLTEGRIDVEQQVKTIFAGNDPLDLLHLIEDNRELTGLGQSAFIRGACWCAPLRLEKGAEA